jgi:hypothetical protein
LHRSHRGDSGTTNLQHSKNKNLSSLMTVVVNFLIMLVNAPAARVLSRLRANFFIFCLNICFHYFLLKLLGRGKIFFFFTPLVVMVERRKISEIL